MPLPSGSPPVLLSLDYATTQAPLPEMSGASLRYQDGQLRLTSSQPDANQGIAADQRVFRDVIVQAQISLAEGSEDDLYGLFLRSPQPDLYYTFAVGPAGHVLISSFDGEYFPLVSGPLDPQLPFTRGLGKPNLFQVVAIGPSLTFLLNGTVITAEIVDERYQEGFLGFYVHHASESPRAELAADWIEIRGIFPEQ
jgi:hypothetical protein